MCSCNLSLPLLPLSQDIQRPPAAASGSLPLFPHLSTTNPQRAFKTSLSSFFQSESLIECLGLPRGHQCRGISPIRKLAHAALISFMCSLVLMSFYTPFLSSFLAARVRPNGGLRRISDPHPFLFFRLDRSSGC